MKKGFFLENAIYLHLSCVTKTNLCMRALKGSMNFVIKHPLEVNWVFFPLDFNTFTHKSILVRIGALQLLKHTSSLQQWNNETTHIDRSQSNVNHCIRIFYWMGLNIQDFESKPKFGLHSLFWFWFVLWFMAYELWTLSELPCSILSAILKTLISHCGKVKVSYCPCIFDCNIISLLLFPRSDNSQTAIFTDG